MANEVRLPVIALQRPGYRSSLGTSDGQSFPNDDDYMAGNVQLVADPLDNLRALNPGKKLLMIRHSVGSAMTVLVASRYPASADGFMVAGCPCDIDRWREWRNASAGKAGR